MLRNITFLFLFIVNVSVSLLFADSSLNMPISRKNLCFTPVASSKNFRGFSSLVSLDML